MTKTRLARLIYGADDQLMYKLGGVIARLTFNTLAEGVFTLTPADNDTNWAGFWDASDSSRQRVVYTGATVNVVPVPEPATMSLLLLGGLGLCGFNNKKTKQQLGINRRPYLDCKELTIYIQ